MRRLAAADHTHTHTHTHKKKTRTTTTREASGERVPAPRNTARRTARGGGGGGGSEGRARGRTHIRQRIASSLSKPRSAIIRLSSSMRWRNSFPNMSADDTMLQNAPMMYAQKTEPITIMKIIM